MRGVTNTTTDDEDREQKRKRRKRRDKKRKRRRTAGEDGTSGCDAGEDGASRRKASEDGTSRRKAGEDGKDGKDDTPPAGESIPDWIRALTMGQVLDLITAKHHQGAGLSSESDGPFSPVNLPAPPLAEHMAQPPRPCSRSSAASSSTVRWTPARPPSSKNQPIWFSVQVNPGKNDKEMRVELSLCGGGLVVFLPPGMKSDALSNQPQLQCGPLTFGQLKLVDTKRPGCVAVCQLIGVDTAWPKDELDKWLADLVLIGHGKTTRGSRDTSFLRLSPNTKAAKATRFKNHSTYPDASCAGYDGRPSYFFNVAGQSRTGCCLTAVSRDAQSAKDSSAPAFEHWRKDEQTDQLASCLFGNTASYDMPKSACDDLLASLDQQQVGSQKLLPEQKDSIFKNILTMMAEGRVPKRAWAFPQASCKAGSIQACWDESKQKVTLSYDPTAASSGDNTEYITFRSGTAILANQTGMGKTVCMLAEAYHCLAVARAFEAKMPLQLREAVRVCLSKNAQQLAGGLVPTTTVLMIVPAAVKDQFELEIKGLPRAMRAAFKCVFTREAANEWYMSEEASRERIIVTSVCMLDPSSKNDNNNDCAIAAFRRYVGGSMFLAVFLDEVTSLPVLKAKADSQGQICKFSPCKLSIIAAKNAAAILAVSASVSDRNLRHSPKRDVILGLLALTGVTADGQSLTYITDTAQGTNAFLNPSLSALAAICRSALSLCRYLFPEELQRLYKCSTTGVMVKDGSVAELYKDIQKAWEKCQTMLKRLGYRSGLHARHISWLSPGYNYQFADLKQLHASASAAVASVRDDVSKLNRAKLSGQVLSMLLLHLDNVQNLLDKVQPGEFFIKFVHQGNLVINDFSRTVPEQLGKGMNASTPVSNAGHADNAIHIPVGIDQMLYQVIADAMMKMATHFVKKDECVLIGIPNTGKGNQTQVYTWVKEHANVKNAHGKKVGSLVVEGHRNDNSKPILLYGPGHGRNIPKTTCIFAMCVDPDDKQYLRQLLGRAQRLSVANGKPVRVYIWFTNSDEPSYCLF